MAADPPAAIGNVIIIGSKFTDILPELASELKLRPTNESEIKHKMPSGHNLIDFSIKGATVNGNINNGGPNDNFFRLVGDGGYDSQVQRLKVLGPDDVVVYGSVGSDLHTVLLMDLVLIDRGLRMFTDRHATNITRLIKKGCQRIVLVHADPDDSDLKELVNLALEGHHGLYKRLPKGIEITLLSIKHLHLESLAAALTLPRPKV